MKHKLIKKSIIILINFIHLFKIKNLIIKIIILIIHKIIYLLI